MLGASLVVVASLAATPVSAITVSNPPTVGFMDTEDRWPTTRPPAATNAAADNGPLPVLVGTGLGVATSLALGIALYFALPELRNGEMTDYGLLCALPLFFGL